LDTFCDGIDPGEVDEIWSHTGKFNLYDPLNLLVAIPSLRSRFFAPVEVKVSETSHYVVGVSEKKNGIFTHGIYSAEKNLRNFLMMQIMIGLRGGLIFRSEKICKSCSRRRQFGSQEDRNDQVMYCETTDSQTLYWDDFLSLEPPVDCRELERYLSCEVDDEIQLCVEELKRCTFGSEEGGGLETFHQSAWPAIHKFVRAVEEKYPGKIKDEKRSFRGEYSLFIAVERALETFIDPAKASESEVLNLAGWLKPVLK
jgi:hypothetical protein